MGVRGLTTFINERAHRCYEDYQLRNCRLVIDGSSLASQLYLSKCSFNSAFGGDYDRYALTIREFFKLLQKCRVSPVVILDGGYEKRKLKTTNIRMKQKWQLMKDLTPASQLCKNVFPCFMKDIFKDVLKELQIPFAQCLFEADEEIAAAAKVLNCPVLSYDSDFFVFNVLYIPFPTLNLRLCKDNSENAKKDDYFLSCSLFRMEKFLKQFGGLEKELVPFFAVLLGNDYISNHVFKSFIKQFKHQKGKTNKKQKKIVGLLEWLRGETFESAFLKLSKFIRLHKRKNMTRQIKDEIANYLNVQCSILDVLGIDEVPPSVSDTTTKEQLAFLEETAEDEGGEEDEDEKEDEDIMDEDSEGEGSSSQEETDGEEMDIEEEDVTIEEGELEDAREENDGKKTEIAAVHRKGRFTWERRMAARLPQWFLERFQRGDFPSSFMDVLVLRTLFSPAQMEDWSLPPAHATAEDAVQQMVCLLLTRDAGEGVEAAAAEAGAAGFEGGWVRRRRDVRWLLRGAGAGGGGVRRVEAPSSSSPPMMPSLRALPSLPHALRLRLLLAPAASKGVEALERGVAQLPPRWRLLAVSVAAWGAAADPAPSPLHLDALLLSLLLLDVVGAHFSVSCAGRRPRRKTKADASALLHDVPQMEDDGKEAESSKENGVMAASEAAEESVGAVERALQAVRGAECQAALQDLRPLCVMDERLKTRPKLFCAGAVHALAQWQSALLHWSHLNALLGLPLPPCPAHRVFNGTFVYNALQRMRGKYGAGDAAAAVARLLHRAPSLLALFKTLRVAMHAVAPRLSPAESERPQGSQSRKRRATRRKKNKNAKRARHEASASQMDQPPSAGEEDSGSGFDDPSNRFSILSVSV